VGYCQNGVQQLVARHMAQDPLVRRDPVSASCSRRPDEGLETKTYSLYPKEHPANCPLRWRVSNDLGVYLSDVTRGLPDIGKSFTLLVCVCFLTSRLTAV
jgi:hypothetical protein